MKNKLNIVVLCGGQSTEHEVSLLSARNVIAALDVKKYKVAVVYITREGSWYFMSNGESLLKHEPNELIRDKSLVRATVALGDQKQPIMSLEDPLKKYAVDCFIPILHGTKGEDGAPQGLMEMLNVPYVGAGILGSTICMQKNVTKCLLRLAQLPTADWVTVQQSDVENCSYEEVSENLGDILFVKPVSLGSSVGISKVRDADSFNKAIERALAYDDQVLIEPCISGLEIEVPVLGNEDPVAALPGQVLPTHEFYSYEAKYVDPNGATFKTPAMLPTSTVEQLQTLAVHAFKVLHCQGMARVDFFVDDDDIIINEVNTIPGFTNISLYPKLWELSGVTTTELLDNLITLARVRFKRQHALSLVRKAVRESDDSSELHI